MVYNAGTGVSTTGDISLLKQEVSFLQAADVILDGKISQNSNSIVGLSNLIDAINPVVYNNPSFSNISLSNIYTSNVNEIRGSTINGMNASNVMVEYNPKVYNDGTTTTFFFDQTYAPSGATQLLSYGFDGNEHLKYKHVVAGVPTDVTFNLT